MMRITLHLAVLLRFATAAQVVVYGATPGGIMAALGAAGEGMSTILIHPMKHVGGMVTGGLGQTDIGDSSVIGGAAEQFFQLVCSLYNRTGACYTFEPHVAEAAYMKLISNATNLQLITEQTLTAVSKTGTVINSITTAPSNLVHSGLDYASQLTDYAGSVFIDGSYEGDLLAMAGVSFSWGRESITDYNESLAGRLFVFELRVHFGYSAGWAAINLTCLLTTSMLQPGNHCRWCTQVNASRLRWPT
jgi:hypothetical protein